LNRGHFSQPIASATGQRVNGFFSFGANGTDGGGMR